MNSAAIALELLQWHNATSSKPDVDTPVLLWFEAEGIDGALPGWEAGWWDGEAWRLAESGGLAGDPVTRWAQPAGPAKKPAGLRFAGWFYELPSAMSYRLWEQGGHEEVPDTVALYEQA